MQIKKSVIVILVLIVVVILGCLVFAWQKGFFIPKGAEEPQKYAVKSSILGNPAMDEAVTNFLLSQQQFSWKTTEGSTNFCVFQNLNPESQLFPVYIWIRCGEFKAVSGQLKEFSGTFLPVKINYPNELSYYDLSKFSFEAPGDGSLYDKDIKKIFPESIWPRLNFESAPLNQKIKEVAEEALLNK